MGENDVYLIIWLVFSGTEWAPLKYDWRAAPAQAPGAIHLSLLLARTGVMAHAARFWQWTTVTQSQSVP